MTNIRSLPLHRLLPWAAALALCALAAAARTFLIQPPEIAHFCEASATWWCDARMAIIYTYAWHTIGEVALGLTVLAMFFRRTWLAAAAVSVGGAALVLYCFESGAVAVISGALLLARAQAPRSEVEHARGAEHHAHQHP